ncbi:MAG: lipid A deacylase LpxR family protein [Campylobacterales bacterium]
MGRLLSGLLTAATLLWAEGPNRCNSGSMTVVFENDVFYGNDRHYTNGLMVAWVPDQPRTPGWIEKLANTIPWNRERYTICYGFAIGQNMYTPSDITLSDPPLNDRPYGGWTYMTTGIAIERGNHLGQLTLSAGWVGPSSKADRTQIELHQLIDSEKPKGWEHQIGDEPGLILAYQHTWRQFASGLHGGNELDLMPHAGFALGNVYTYANAGMTIRYGSGLQKDYGPLRIQPAPPGSGAIGAGSKKRVRWYLFAGMDIRAVARNIFLDGNTFKSSRSVEKEPIVADWQSGVSIAYKKVRFSYVHVYRSKEFAGADDWDDFGAVSLFWFF